jgi:predicted nucleic acid-binding protein
MPAFYLDSSALVKRYVPETGSDILNALFVRVPAQQMIVSSWAVAETVAALNRKKNDTQMTSTALASTINLLLDETDLCWQPKVDSASVRDSLDLITRHNLNATDALHLHVVLHLQKLLSQFETNLVLVTSDQRLLRAAKAEDLITIDPEQISESELRKFL